MAPPTVLLGQFTDEHAEAIAEQLERAGIVWYHKTSGRVVQIMFRGEWGTRLFVERGRLDDAKAIAKRVLGGDKPGSRE